MLTKTPAGHEVNKSHDPNTLNDSGTDIIKTDLVDLSGDDKNNGRELSMLVSAQTGSFDSLNTTEEIILFNGRHRLDHKVAQFRGDKLFSRSMKDRGLDATIDSHEDPVIATTDHLLYHNIFHGEDPSSVIPSTSQIQSSQSDIPSKGRMKATQGNVIHTPRSVFQESALVNHQSNIQSSKRHRGKDLNLRSLHSDFKRVREPNIVIEVEAKDVDHSPNCQQRSGSESSCILESLNQLSLVDKALGPALTMLSESKKSKETPYPTDLQGQTSTQSKAITQRAAEQTTLPAASSMKLYQDHLDADIVSSASLFVTKKWAIDDSEGTLSDSDDDEKDPEVVHWGGVTDREIAQELAEQDVNPGCSQLQSLYGRGECGRAGQDNEGGHDDIELLHQGARSFVTTSTDAGQILGKDSPFLDRTFLGELDSPYRDFDVMDHHRPSILAGSKRRQRPQMYGLFDDELGSSMLAAWENDRLRKRSRKQQRGDLRLHGLLGNSGQSTLRSKYPNGMSFNQIRDELGNFLQSERER